MKTAPKSLKILLASIVLAFSASTAHAQAFDAMAVISSTMGTNANRLCMAEATRGDLGCPLYAPLVSSTGGNLSSMGAVVVSNSTATCSAATTGAIRYNGTEFQTCFGSGGWATLTSAAVSGTIGNQVAFSVHRNGTDQGVSSGTFTKMSWSNEYFDTNNNFASSRFTPTVPGKYFFSFSTQCANSNACAPAIYKNGVQTAYNYIPGSGGPIGAVTTAILDMNGTTDYVEAWGFNAGGTYIFGDPVVTNFQGALINARGASGSGGATALSGLTDVTLASPANGQVLSYNGSAWVNSTTTGGSAMGDRLISSTMEILANGATGYVSLSTASSTWGYLGSAASYLPRISTAFASATTISASYVQIPSATTALACSSGVAGTMRYTSGTMQVCNGSSWGNVGIGMPTGTIAAFSTASCPAGWSEYTPARGRFLRGIDNGAGLDPDGTRSAGATQADAFQGHIHTYETANQYDDLIGGSGNSARIQTTKSTGNPVNDGTNGTPRTANETRPKNVAVTYCQYNGYDSATSGSLWSPNGANITYMAGNVGIGASNPGSALTVSGGANYIAQIVSTVPANGSTHYMINFTAGGGNAGGIFATSTATTYATTSDHRLKEGVVGIKNALGRVDQLKPSRFSFRSDPSHTVVDGFIAHEVQAVAPYAVTGTKDQVDKDGKPIYQQVDYGKLTPLLTAAVQELKKENDALKARVGTLEARMEALEKK